MRPTPSTKQGVVMVKGLMLKLKLHYFDHLMWTADSLEKTLMLGKIEGRRRGQQRMRCLDGITNSMDKLGQTPGDGEGQGNLACCSSWGHKESDTTWRLNNDNRELRSHMPTKLTYSNYEAYAPQLKKLVCPNERPRMMQGTSCVLQLRPDTAK